MEIANNISKSIDIKTESTKKIDPKAEDGENCCKQQFEEVLSKLQDIKTKDELRRSELRLGIVGRGEGVDKLDVWLDLCRSGIVAKESELSNLFKGFGGVSADYGFFTRLLSSPGFTRALQKSSIVKVSRIKTREERVVAAVNLYYEQVQFLAENRAIDVIICVIPEELFLSLTQKDAGSKKDTGSVEQYMEHDFRRLLKAKCMHLGIPLQLVLESTLLTGKANRGNQDDATRALNFATALYYLSYALASYLINNIKLAQKIY